VLLPSSGPLHNSGLPFNHILTQHVVHHDYSQKRYIHLKVNSKGLPRTGHEGPEGEQRYSSTLSLTSALDGVGGERHAPAAFPPRERPGTHCIRSWVGPRAGLDGCGKSHPHWDLIDGPSSP
jgi:hypothetical protein